MDAAKRICSLFLVVFLCFIWFSFSVRADMRDDNPVRVTEAKTELVIDLTEPPPMEISEYEDAEIYAYGDPEEDFEEFRLDGFFYIQVSFS